MNYKQRIEICEACEHFTSAQTCGTPITGNVVIHDGQEIKLPGGFAFTKAKVDFLSCPIGKWTGLITEKERVELYTFLKDSIMTGRVDIQKINHWWNKTHPNDLRAASGCAPCNNAKLDELWVAVKDRK